MNACSLSFCVSCLLYRGSVCHVTRPIFGADILRSNRVLFRRLQDVPTENIFIFTANSGLHKSCALSADVVIWLSW